MILFFFRDELPTTLALPTSLRDSDSRQHLSSMALLGKGDFNNIPFFVCFTYCTYLFFEKQIFGNIPCPKHQQVIVDL